MEGVAPMCPSCNHAHFPEVKCAVCGHKGKGQAYLLIAKVRLSGPACVCECLCVRACALVRKRPWPLAPYRWLADFSRSAPATPADDSTLMLEPAF